METPTELPTLYASNVIWTLISPLTGSFSNGVNLEPRRISARCKNSGDHHVLVPMIDCVIMYESWFDLDSAEEGMGVFRAVVDIAYQMRFFRRNIAR